MIRETLYCTKSLDHAMLTLSQVRGYPLPSGNTAVASIMQRGQRHFAGADIFYTGKETSKVNCCCSWNAAIYRARYKQEDRNSWASRDCGTNVCDV